MTNRTKLFSFKTKYKQTLFQHINSQTRIFYLMVKQIILKTCMRVKYTSISPPKDIIIMEKHEKCSLLTSQHSYSRTPLYILFAHTHNTSYFCFCYCFRPDDELIRKLSINNLMILFSPTRHMGQINQNSIGVCVCLFSFASCLFLLAVRNLNFFQGYYIILLFR